MAISNKIDFVLFVSAQNANPNGDPLTGNRPRLNNDGRGEISDVCIRRKIRNRMQDLGAKIFLQSEEHPGFDGEKSLYDRAKNKLDKEVRKDRDKYAQKACEEWVDVRAFGQVFAFNSDDKGCSASVRGPVTIHQALSVHPVEIKSLKITKSVNGDPSETKDRSSMGNKHMVAFGLYTVKGSVNVQLAEKTGFSDEDAALLKECLRTLFVNDASSARPDGSMEVCRLYWWEHNCKDGQYSSAKVHRSVTAKLKDGVEIPTSFDDYVVEITHPLDGLTPEVYEGV